MVAAVRQVFLLSLLLVLASTGRASQVFHQATPLAEVLQQTEAAVLLQLAKPAMRPVAIPVPGDDKKDCGTYSYGVWRAKVTRIVHAEKASGISVGQTVVVFPADTPELIGISREACLTGMTESPIFGRFEGVKPEDNQQVLALLRWLPGYGWAEAVSGSWLAPGDARKIARKLKRRELLSNPALLPAGQTLCVVNEDCVQSYAHCSPCGYCPGWNGRAFTLSSSARIVASCQVTNPPPRVRKPGGPMPKPPPAVACSPCPQSDAVGGKKIPVECKDMRCRFVQPAGR